MDKRMKNNFKKTTNKIIPIVIGTFVLAGCQYEKTICVPMNSKYTFQVNQNIATTRHPSNFYLCGSRIIPYVVVTNRWSGDVVNKFKKPRKYLVTKMHHNSKSALSTKKSREKSDENINTKNNCFAK
jgi:hypothetical protein